MRASTTYQNGGSKVTKIAIVTALHLAVALGLMNMKAFKPKAPAFFPEPITQRTEKVPPVKPETADTDTKKLAPPEIFVPKTIVDVEKPVLPDTPIAKALPPGPAVDPGKTGGGTPDGTGTGAGKVIAAIPKPYTPATAGDCARPDYPARAARNGDMGTVTLALLIGSDGKVAEAKVSRTSGFKDLDRAAISALSMCKFKPAMNNGVPESAWGQIAYVWSLE